MWPWKSTCPAGFATTAEVAIFDFVTLPTGALADFATAPQGFQFLQGFGAGSASFSIFMPTQSFIVFLHTCSRSTLHWLCLFPMALNGPICKAKQVLGNASLSKAQVSKGLPVWWRHERLARPKS